MKASSSIAITRAGAADAAAARAFLLSIFPYDPTWHTDIDDIAGAYARTPGQALFLAREAGGAIVGAAAIRDRLTDLLVRDGRFAGLRVAELGRVGVAEAFRRQGVAVALVAAAHDWALTEGRYERVVLHTDRDNLPARSLWRSLGRELTDLADADALYFELLPSHETLEETA